MTPEELRKWREKHKLSQPELAELLSVDPMTISRWERGKRTMPPFLHIALKWLSSKRNRKKLLDTL